MPLEIERKYLLSSLPSEVRAVAPITISQGYIFTEPGELRVREEAGVRFVVTVKGDGDLSRQEWSAELPHWAFDLLWRQTECRRICKLRRVIKNGPWTLEVDEYLNELAGLYVVEVEFPNEGAAAEFELPWWAQSAREVTHIAAYKNKQLATYGAPTGL